MMPSYFAKFSGNSAVINLSFALSGSIILQKLLKNNIQTVFQKHEYTKVQKQSNEAGLSAVNKKRLYHAGTAS
jgi:hypothetical protein